MRKLIFVIFLFSFIQAKADVEYKALGPYLIISDVISNDTPLGMTRVKGCVFNFKGEAASGALVSNMAESSIFITDSTGYYELFISEKDTSIFMALFQHSEIAIAAYDFTAGHTVTINFFASLEIPEPNNQIISFKPVIYLYAETPLTASVSIDYKGELTFMYPTYQNGWTVNVTADGMTNAESNKDLPYLFWEGEMDGLDYVANQGSLEGFAIHSDSVVSFLENQLSAMGLNAKEQTDFITFWGPRMLNNDYLFIQFLVDEAYSTEVATIDVEPKPDALRRIYMLYSPLNELPTFKYKPQSFKKFERNGFTVVEWGGSEIEMTYEL